MTDDLKFRSEKTKRAILAIIECDYKMTDEQMEILKNDIKLLVDDISSYPIQYAE